MIKAPHLNCDEKRVESLNRLQLLDTPIEERFERIMRMGRRMLNVPIVAFTLVDTHRQTFKAVQGMDACDVDRGVSFCGHAIAGEDLFIIPDVHKDERFFDNPLVNLDPGIGFYAGCPVRAPDGEKIGVICIIDSCPREITEDQIQGIRDIVATVEVELRANAVSAAQKELLNDLNAAERQALVDPLTRVWNRNGVFELLKKEWDIALANKTSVGILIADIDHFKAVNDTHGHLAGDEVIKRVAESLVACVGSNGFVGRIGGEEFLMVIPEIGATEPLTSIAERIRCLIETTPIHTKSGDLKITMSLGAIEAYAEKSISVEECISRADKALYAAKKNGRNKVELAYMAQSHSEHADTSHTL